LCDAGGELLEGSQTNFYAVHDGALWTADDGVLAGTVRNLVLRTHLLPPCTIRSLCTTRRTFTLDPLRIKSSTVLKN
jgi:branched-subunit amino acid aminotransferase/4-amino-4-deoxychorismate lyase